ncbi:MAG: insulinase family protein [Phycisphaerae bacterium]|nr:insulinase family protein [Phycisphaerae bacterium]
MMACLIIAVTLLPSLSIEPRITRLDNALTTITVEDHALPLVSVQLWFHTGSAADNPAQPGLCHVARTLLEHHDDAALKLRAAGVRFDSSTYYDAISFSSVLPPNFLEHVLIIEARRLASFEVSADELRLATNAAAREVQWDADQGLLTPDRRLREALFGDHPYRHRPDLVSVELAKLKPADMQEFLGRWIVPGNATLFIVGDIKHEDALKLVRRHFDALPWREPPRAPQHALPPPERLEPIRIHGERGVVLIAWLAPPAGYFENAAYHVLMQRLCNEFDGLLTTRLREAGFDLPPRWQEGQWRDASILALRLVLPVNQWLSPQSGDRGRQGDTDTASADSAPTSQRMLRMLDEALAEAAETLPTPTEFDRARALELLRLRHNRSSFGARAVSRAESEVVGGNVLLEDRAESRVRTLGVDNIREAALKLQSARRAVVIVAPKLDPSPIPPLMPLIEPQAPERLDPGAATQLLARHAGDAPQPSAASPTPRIHTREISTGITAVVCHTRGLATVAVYTCAEHRWPTPQRISDVLDSSGTPSHTSAELKDYASLHGLDIRTAGPRGWCGYAFTGHPMHTPQMIELQAEMLQHALRPDESTEPTSPIRIVVVGDVDPDEVFECLGGHWQTWSTGQPRDRGEETRPPSGFEFNANASALESPDTWLYIAAARDPQESPSSRDLLSWRTIVRLLGYPKSASPTLGWDWRSAWQADMRSADAMVVQTDSSPEHIPMDIRGLANRLKELRSGQLAPTQIETAIRLARMDQLQRLDNVHDIATTLFEHPLDPWDIAADLTPETLRASWPACSELHLTWVSLSGGDVDDALADEVRTVLEPFSEPKSD